MIVLPLLLQKIVNNYGMYRHAVADAGLSKGGFNFRALWEVMKPLNPLDLPLTGAYRSKLWCTYM